MHLSTGVADIEAALRRILGGHADDCESLNDLLAVVGILADGTSEALAKRVRDAEAERDQALAEEQRRLNCGAECTACVACLTIEVDRLKARQQQEGPSSCT